MMPRLIAGALAALLLGLATPLHAQTPGSLPPGDGRDLVATACSQCHTLSVIVAGRDGPVGWKNHVYNMVIRGAQLTPRETETVIQYLITHFGPGAPATETVTLPLGPGKELVETRCAVWAGLNCSESGMIPTNQWVAGRFVNNRRAARPTGGRRGYRSHRPAIPPSPAFRTIQVYPKDIGSALRAQSVSSSGDLPPRQDQNGERS